MPDSLTLCFSAI